MPAVRAALKAKSEHRETGLPTVARDNFDVTWGATQLACKQVTQPSSGGKEPSSVDWTMKAIRTLPFL